MTSQEVFKELEKIDSDFRKESQAILTKIRELKEKINKIPDFAKKKEDDSYTDAERRLIDEFHSEEFKLNICVYKKLDAEAKLKSILDSANQFRVMRRHDIIDTVVSMTTADKYKKGNKGQVNPVVVYQRENVLAYIQEKLSGFKIRNSTHKLLDAAMMKYAESKNGELVISMTLQEYMKLCGLKSETTAHKQVKEDLEILEGLVIEKTGPKGFARIRIVGSNILKNNMITLGLDSIFANIYLNDKFFSTFVAPEIFMISDKHNPNSYHLGRFIHVHKGRNLGKPNENVISVRQLLKVCPNLATVEELREKGIGQIRRKIIIPFERDMDALSDVFTWSYKEAGENGRILTREESAKLSFNEFIELNVFINWIKYPVIEAEFTDKTKKTAKKS